jgi:hypothetical protein
MLKMFRDQEKEVSEAGKKNYKERKVKVRELRFQSVLK